MVRSWSRNWHRFWQPATRLRSDDRAAVGVEYGLLCALIAMTILGGLRALGVSLVNLPLPSLVAAFQGALS
jgi:Flp pilus assembly pilin Flp